MLRLSNGNGNEPLIVPWPHGLPCQVEMGWDGKQYELRATYRVQPLALPQTGEVAGIDLGEVHLAVAHDGTQTTILNGGYVRAVRRYQHKLKAKRDAYIDRKKKGSQRRRRSIQAKKRRLQKVAYQLKDALHKLTTNLVSTMHKQGVQTVVIGDIRAIRKGPNADHGHTANQRLHQMPAALSDTCSPTKPGCWGWRWCWWTNTIPPKVVRPVGGGTSQRGVCTGAATSSVGLFITGTVLEP